MNNLFIVNKRRDWPFEIRGVKVVPARLYLSDPAYADCAGTRVFNLCQSWRYQSRGYYVSMLADARGHQPMPDVKAIEDMQSATLVQSLADSLNDLIQASLAEVDAASVELAIYFGRNAEPHLRQLSEQLFKLLRVPLLLASFERQQGHWQLHGVRSLHLGEITPERLPTVAQAAADSLSPHRSGTPKPALALLRTPGARVLPSNPAAIQKFQEAAEAAGMRSELITEADAGRVTEFDALFIRDTTNIHHYTYQMARQAAVAGMVVLDDCDSILKCGNKVFMTELLNRNHIPMPKTMMVHRDNLERVIPALGLPCILKLPDGAFSLGVEKVRSEQELLDKAHQFFAHSELVLAQEYMPTEFDWRIGILDRRPLFVCKYHMVPGHWQIVKHEQDREVCEGRSEALAISDAPAEVIDLALRAANLVGDGFYGVDLKQRGNHCYIIEINDNPNVDAGNEDGVLKDALYREVMGVLRKRIDERKDMLA